MTTCDRIRSCTSMGALVVILTAAPALAQEAQLPEHGAAGAQVNKMEGAKTDKLMLSSKRGLSAEARVLAQVHAVNQAEITAGQLAKDKGQSQATKDFGARMITDHQAADQKVASLAAQKGLALDNDAGRRQLRLEQQAAKPLQTATGADFDVKYAQIMMKAHEGAIKLLQSEQRQASDKDVKALIAELLPTIQAHETAAAAMTGMAH
jgi:predicted outer membrane protein